MTEKKNIAIIIPRFLPNIAGGAEKLALDYAIILKDFFNIEIFTSCAKDYITWKNELPNGKEDWNGIIIQRFKVEKTRDINSMNTRLNSILKKGKTVSEIDEEKFIEEQGPYSPSLVNGFLDQQHRFHLVILVGYLYYPILKILPKVQIRKMIVPTFHEEPALSLPIYQRVFLPKYTYSFNAPEELSVYQKRFSSTPNHVLIGTYVKTDHSSLHSAKNGNKISLLTLGRMEAAKGFQELFQYYDSWMKSYDCENLDWISIGSNHLAPKDIPNSVNIKGFVSEKEKESLLLNASIVINPSPFESFSIAMMEAWSFGKPVLVNGKSDVMRGHNLRSQGGLHYSDETSFRRCLEYLIERPDLRLQLGENGKKYVLANFSKEVVTKKLIETVNILLG